MVQCNLTLAHNGDEAVALEETLWKGFTFHHFGLLVTAAFGLLAVLVTAYLIIQHSLHYSRPWEQKHIIRILFMIPIYAIVSFLSYWKFYHSIYWEVLRDCYEAFAIASFFTLLCNYLEPTLHDQKEFFRRVKPKNWAWPITWYQKCTGGTERGLFRIPRSGLTWFNIIWFCIFQYCCIRVLCTFIAMISQFYGRYCESSLRPEFAHIWVVVFQCTSVTAAMYCLIQFYIQLKDVLAQHKPFLKVLCIKLVIFFSFWQNLLISLLSSERGPLKPSKWIAYPDIKIGIPSMMLAIEMAIFAFLHIWAFPYQPYRIPASKKPSNDEIAQGDSDKVNSPAHYLGGCLGVKAIIDAFNIWDMIKAAARGFRWIFFGVRHRKKDVSYRQSIAAARRNTLISGTARNTEIESSSPQHSFTKEV